MHGISLELNLPHDITGALVKSPAHSAPFFCPWGAAAMSSQDYNGKGVGKPPATGPETLNLALVPRSIVCPYTCCLVFKSSAG